MAKRRSTVWASANSCRVPTPEHVRIIREVEFDYVYMMKRRARTAPGIKGNGGHLFPAAAKTREFRYVPISRKIEGDEHTTMIGSYGGFSGHLIEGGYGGAPKVTNPPLADPTHKEFLQGEATKLTYKDAGQDWKYENSNYMRNKFQTSSKEYEKVRKGPGEEDGADETEINGGQAHFIRATRGDYA